MIRQSFALLILVVMLLVPATGLAQSAMDCIRLVWVDLRDVLGRIKKHEHYYNTCTKTINIGFCYTKINSQFMDPNHPSHCDIQPRGDEYYVFKTLEPGRKELTGSGYGDFKWAACFAPKRPVAANGGRKFICRNLGW